MLKWTPKTQGNQGEASAIEWFTVAGALVWRPVFEHPDYDLIAEWEDGRLERVQVKTSGYWRDGRWSVAICTRGGNQSWSGLVKRMNPARCDSLFIHVADGRRWYVPIHVIDGTTSVNLGGPKYAAYEVDRGCPFAVRKPGLSLIDR